MPRIRQQYWFCLAAICLVGSLIGIWSTDIEVAEQVATTPSGLEHGAIFRSLDHLPPDMGFAADQLSVFPRRGLSSEAAAEPPLIQAPAGVPGRMASPLNTSSRIIPRERITPVGFQHAGGLPSPPPVWLSGKIEALEPIPAEQY